MTHSDSFEDRLRHTLNEAARQLTVTTPEPQTPAATRRVAASARWAVPAFGLASTTLTIVVVAVIGAGALVLVGRHHAPASRATSVAPSVQPNQVGSERMLIERVRALRGRPIVVFMWASWCAPCRDQFSVTSAAARRFRGRVAFVGVDVQDPRADAQRLLHERPLPFPSFRGGPDLRPLLPIAPEGIPATLFVDGEGRLVARHLGLYESQRALLGDISTNLLTTTR